jgi:hypothetical protein
MRRLTTGIALTFLMIAGLSFQPVSAQSVLNPADPVITYDSLNKPVEPAWGQVGKWVRTVRMSWNTDEWKAYIYKGMPFRLHFPKSYAHGVSDGKKYPVLLFFHGLGEIGHKYDNEFQMLHGHQFFQNTINSGAYDGYVLSIHSPGSFGITEFTNLRELIDYMVTNNKVDGFHVAVNGLSAGGQGSWEMAINNPTYVSAALPMSWSSILYTDPAIVAKVKNTALWVFQGGKDGNPAPGTTYAVQDAINGAGGNMKVTEYPELEHWTWDAAWQDPDFFPFIKRSYSSNPWPQGGKTDFFAGETINVTLSLPAGFSAYEWRKDGVLISGATSNTYQATQLGSYSARVQRNGIWSDWSITPAVIKTKTAVAIPGKIEAEAWGAQNSVQAEWTSDAGGGQNVAYIDYNDWIDYNINVPSAGDYNVRFRIATQLPNGRFHVKNSSGTILATLDVPYTGGWQTWQTINRTITLPAGPQTIRLVSAGDSWNINWLEFVANGVANVAPVANAGQDQTITFPTNSVTLNGSGVDADGSIASYYWTKISGNTGEVISNRNIANPTVSNLGAGTYTFRLRVTDNSGVSVTDDVIIIVNATATSTVHYEAESWSAMSGVQTETTSDAGGGLNVGYIDPGDWLEYIISPTTTGTYKLDLRIASNVATAQVRIQKQDGTVLGTVDVTSTGGWQVWKTFTTKINLTAGQQTIRLVCASGGYNINWLELTPEGSTTTNLAPVANAGDDKVITLPSNSVTLTGTGTDADGSIASYSWSKISGPSQFTIASPSSASTSVSNLVEGVYEFQLTVTDNAGATGKDIVKVTVNGSTPSSTTIHLEAENYTSMSGVQTENTSDAGGGLNVGYIDYGDWMDYSINPANTGSYTVNLRVASQHTGAQVQIKKGDGTILTTVTVPNTGGWQNWQTVSVVINLAAGSQTIRLVSANTSNWNINWLDVIQGGTVNQAPTANAGADQTITLPTSSVQLAGSGTDADGTIASYAWSKISGPAGGTFSSTTIANPVVSNLSAGTYVFRLSVTDNGGAGGYDDVSIVVNSATASYVPVPAKIEAEHWSAMSGVQTEGTSDAGGGINVGYIDNGDWLDYNISTTAAGTYTLFLRVASQHTGAQVQVKKADGTTLATITVPNTGGWQSWQTVSVPVALAGGNQVIRLFSANSSNWNINWLEFKLPVSNTAPTANAGTDKSITLPTNSVTLSGSGSDADGSISSYSWTKISGPSQFTIGTPSQASTSVSNLVEGTYIFRLTVTDNGGATGSDDVTVVVNPAPVASTKIEAENWVAMRGVSTQTTSDIGGGLNVTSIDKDDYTDYNINIPSSGTYTMRFRVASSNTGAQFQVRRSGTTLGTLNVPNTGGYQVWQTISAGITFSAGAQTIRIYSMASPRWTFNWLEIVPPGGTMYNSSFDAVIEEQTGRTAPVFEIYPNPVTDGFQLKLDGATAGRVNVQVIGANGTVHRRQVLTRVPGASQHYIDLTGLAKGEYILLLQMAEWKETRKLIKL